MSLINREALYEKACDLEAQALSYVGKIVNDETKIEEWKIWSAILTERTAFKHDIFDAPEVKPEPKWIPISERLPEEDGTYIVSGKWGSGKLDVGECGYNKHDGYFGTSWNFDVVAWMPLPEPYQAERRNDA